MRPFQLINWVEPSFLLLLGKRCSYFGLSWWLWDRSAATPNKQCDSCWELLDGGGQDWRNGLLRLQIISWLPSNLGCISRKSDQIANGLMMSRHSAVGVEFQLELEFERCWVRIRESGAWTPCESQAAQRKFSCVCHSKPDKPPDLPVLVLVPCYLASNYR